MKKVVVLIAISLISLSSFSQFSNPWFSFNENSTNTMWQTTQVNTSIHFADNYDPYANQTNYTDCETDEDDIYEDAYYVDQYECYPMEPRKFRYALSSIKRKSFSDTQLRLAKQIVNNNCLTVRQIKKIASIFSFESTKLDFVKYAYNQCYDPENYWMINDVFSFSSSTDELDDYLYGM